MNGHDPAPLDLDDDDTLVTLLGASLDEGDPVPDRARQVAMAAFDLGHVEGELAVVVTDSAHEAPLVGARFDDTTDRYVELTSSRLRVEIDLPSSAVLVLGQVDPPGVGRALIEFASAAGGVERVEVELDDLGRFQCPLRAGAMRMRFSTDAGPVVTPWIVR